MSSLEAWGQLFELENKLTSEGFEDVLHEFVDKWKDRGLNYLELLYTPADFSDGDYSEPDVYGMLTADSALLSNYSFYTLPDFVDYCETAGGYKSIIHGDEFDNIQEDIMVNSPELYTDDGINLYYTPSDGKPVIVADVAIHTSALPICSKDIEFKSDLAVLTNVYLTTSRNSEQRKKTFVKVMKNGEVFVHTASYYDY